MQLAELDAEEEEELENNRAPPDRDALVGEWVEQSPFNEAEETPYRPNVNIPRRQPMESAPAKTQHRDTSKERRLPGRAIEELASTLQAMAKPRPTPRAFYELPNFYGDPADWLFFKRRYEESTATFDFRPTENMARIQMAVQGKAKELIEDLLRTSSDPDELIRVLDRTYGNPNTLLQCAMKKVKNLPNVTDNDSEALRSFSSAVRSCVSTLKNIKADGYLNNPQLVRELLDKLTPSQRTEYSKFARRVSSECNIDLRVSPTLTVLVDFLDELADTAAYMVCADSSGASTKPNPSKATASKQPWKPSSNPPKIVHKVLEVSEKVPVSVVSCEMCKGEHKLPNCDAFKKMVVDSRWDLVKKEKLCFKCLVRRHNRLSCRAKKCSKCNYNHHTLLHVTKPDKEESNEATQTERVTNLGDQRMKSLLKVVPVTLMDGDVERHTYALLDDGATVSLIDSSMAAHMDGPKVPLHIISAGGHSVIDQGSKSVQVVLRGPNNKSHTLTMRTIKNIKLPPQTIPTGLISRCKHLRGLNCAEMEDAEPLLLIGQDNWQLIVGGDIRRGKSGQPVASLTQLGWVIHVNHITELNELVKRQFELDSIGITEEKRVNYEDARATSILDSTAKLTNQGWEVGLLWKKENVDLPDNYRDAEKRLKGIEKKMDRDPEFAESYCAQVNRLLHRGYARKINGPFTSPVTWYLPHFGVTNVNKPGKLRLVFDAAATYKGTSLNDNLLSGPDLLNPLLSILFRFRSKPIAMTADIEDMFLRIKIREDDQGAQLFLWRGMDRQKTPEIYVMDSMIFGAASSPSSAIFVLNRNADRFANDYPEAVEAIQKHHYMDDYIDSVEDVGTALKLIKEITEIHRQGNFNIRGWTTNDAELREKLPSVVPENVKLSNLGGETERTLGLMWSTGEDTLTYDLSFKKLRQEIVDGEEVPTKREFLRFIMSLFDPLGLICPITISSRILMQKIWRAGTQWDEALNEDCYQDWKKWLNELVQIRNIKIPRWYGLRSKTVELHVFGDASEKAYSAVAYFVDDFKNVALVAGKARVTPIKLVSIPRLELQAAVLVSRLAETIKKDADFDIIKTTLWTDSKTALIWIRSNPREYKPFRSDINDWRWVPTSENPADEATRSGWTDEKSIWFSGPAFLRKPPEEWPCEDGSDATDEAASELRANPVYVATETAKPIIDVTRFTTWTRAVRTTARILAWARGVKAKTGPRVTGQLVDEAEEYLLRKSQEASFATELQNIQKGEMISSKSKLKHLDPMLTEDGLLRVRGRLVTADLPFEERHPIILDGRDPTTELLVRHYHQRAFHANTETVVNLLREKYWIIKLRPTVKRIAQNCQLCRVRKAKPNPPKMGDLPPARMTHHRRAFTHCGIDYFGPMEVTIGRRREKRWGVVLTCLTTRAIHLELAASLSADSAILALRRFIARRGQPEVIYSDRGTNFVGANRELQNALKEMDFHKFEDAAVTRGIKWSFISPASPHMGGCWERLVRSTKTALRSTLKERAPREEILQTLLAEIEAMINSRPLTHVAVDPRDPVALTPNHLLLGTASNTTRLGTFSERDLCTKKQWRIVQALADLFWRRWIKEYLSTLQTRQKWTEAVTPLKPGDVVIILDNTLPRNVWPKGVIERVYPGADGQVRIADVKTSHGILRRPATKIAVLPTEPKDSD
ncbi:hypothetical protein ABMA28_000762 [Loxostege sticticalis]|uniref:Integrase catalytic domain-containing protein n=1 Tax=Loxostege sticticalis TaxID=481309 RepID=A0ABD0T3G1_LOXSC